MSFIVICIEPAELPINIQFGNTSKEKRIGFINESVKLGKLGDLFEIDQGEWVNRIKNSFSS